MKLSFFMPNYLFFWAPLLPALYNSTVRTITDIKHTHTHTHIYIYIYIYIYIFFFYSYNPLWVCILQPSSGAIASSHMRFLDNTQRNATVSGTPLDEWSVRHRDLYLTTHNAHNKHTCPRWDSNPQSQQASGCRSTP